MSHQFQENPFDQWINIPIEIVADLRNRSFYNRFRMGFDIGQDLPLIGYKTVVGG